MPFYPESEVRVWRVLGSRTRKQPGLHRDNEIARDCHERMKEYYDRLAPEYEEHEAFREEAAEDLPGRVISLLPPAKVLDVACGPGLLTGHLGLQVTGLDQSEAMLEVARGRVPRPSSCAATRFGCRLQTGTSPEIRGEISGWYGRIV